MTNDPVAILQRIAYLLERNRAETYKVRAFRNAATAIADIAPDKLIAMSPSELASIPHVGPTSATVIVEALSGKTPSYLAKLEAEPVSPMSPDAAAICGELRGDCHSHSDWSDGTTSIREMAESAKDLGHEYWALTDHSPRLTIAHGLDQGRLCKQLDVVAELNARLAPFRILTGIEVDILEDGALDQTDDLLGRLDVVVASVHSKLRMDKAEMTKRMVRAIKSPHVDILGHCTGRIIVGRGRPESTFDVEQVFEACAATGTAVEINSRPERLDPPEELLGTALSLGCVVTIDTDAHAPGQLEWQRFGCEKAALVHLPVDQIMNTLPMEKFLAWTSSHAA